MALITEDGTGLSTAESFASVTFANTYHTNRGNTLWTGADAVKEAALRKATDYIQAKYNARWDGYRMTDTQALDWPRDYVVRASALNGTIYWPNNSVPNDVAVATCILALKSLSAELMPDVERSTIREKVDVIEVEYDGNAPLEKRFAEVDRLLTKFFKSGGEFVHKVIR